MNEQPLTQANKTAPDRPDDILDGIGSAAWQAYNAMETTKRRHFELLELIDNKKKNFNIDPTEYDQRLIACLLKDHDEQVKRFTSASLALKNESAEAHLALFTYIGGVNNASEARQTTH